MDYIIKVCSTYKDRVLKVQINETYVFRYTNVQSKDNCLF